MKSLLVSLVIAFSFFGCNSEFVENSSEITFRPNTRPTLSLPIITIPKKPGVVPPVCEESVAENVDENIDMSCHGSCNGRTRGTFDHVARWTQPSTPENGEVTFVFTVGGNLSSAANGTEFLIKDDSGTTRGTGTFCGNSSTGEVEIVAANISEGHLYFLVTNTASFLQSDTTYTETMTVSLEGTDSSITLAY